MSKITKPKTETCDDSRSPTWWFVVIAIVVLIVVLLFAGLLYCISRNTSTVCESSPTGSSGTCVYNPETTKGYMRQNFYF